MGSHLKVDLSMLAETAAALDALHGEFSDAASIADGGSAAVGESSLQDALHDFQSNWSVHRKSLVASLDAVRKMAHQSHDTYQGVDRGLARSLQQAMSGATTSTSSTHGSTSHGAAR